MKPTTSDVINELTLAEAAAWLTRLQGDERTASTEAAFKDWLSTSPAHGRAFARVSDVWDLLPGALEPVDRGTERRQSAPRRRVRERRRYQWLVATAAAALLLVTVGVVRVLLPTDRTYETAVGEQRTVVLDDQTRVTLNTGTRLVVKYSRSERHILLEDGEAVFHVAKNPRRPFVVETSLTQVVALGTVFDVRRHPQHVDVTLLEGKVWVAARTAAPGQSAVSTVLSPGERLVMRNDGGHALDRPDIEAAMAWQHGQIYFDDSTLADAIAELNRYGGEPIRVSDPALAALRISGVFSLQDPAQFATAVASLHGLHVVRDGGALTLAR